MKGLSVLLVEDNLEHADLVRMALADVNPSCQVSHVETGEDALQSLGQSGAPRTAQLPDFVLLDVNLPLMSGHDVLRKLKLDAVLRCIPVVMLTTSQSPNDIEQSYAAHANSYVVKPTSFSALKNLMRDVVRYWQEVNVPTSRQR